MGGVSNGISLLAPFRCVVLAGLTHWGFGAVQWGGDKFESQLSLDADSVFVLVS